MALEHVQAPTNPAGLCASRRMVAGVAGMRAVARKNEGLTLPPHLRAKRPIDGVWPSQRNAPRRCFPISVRGCSISPVTERALPRRRNGPRQDRCKRWRPVRVAAAVGKSGRLVLVVTAASLQKRMGGSDSAASAPCRFRRSCTASRSHAARQLRARRTAPFFTIVTYEADADATRWKSTNAPAARRGHPRRSPAHQKLEQQDRAQAVKRLQQPLRLGVDGHAHRKPHRRACIHWSAFSIPRFLDTLFRFNREFYEFDERGQTCAAIATSTSCARASGPTCCSGGARPTWKPNSPTRAERNVPRAALNDGQRMAYLGP